MKKFTDKRQEELSKDIIDLETNLEQEVENSKLDGEWEIINIIDVSKNMPTNEAIIINAELGDKTIKRGDYIYVTALINRKDAMPYHQHQMGVIKCRIIDIHQNLFILNSLR